MSIALLLNHVGDVDLPRVLILRFRLLVGLRVVFVLIMLIYSVDIVIVIV